MGWGEAPDNVGASPAFPYKRVEDLFPPLGGLPEHFLEIAHFCAVECELQRSGPLSVANMLSAWSYAMKCPQQVPTLSTILTIGRLVEPEVNRGGLREYDVRVGDSHKPEWQRVPTLMASFLLVQDYTPEEWFRLYEEIHPFGDGNGRSGVILYNLLRGTLLEPEWAPDFWNDYRRQPGYGAP